MIEYRNLNYGKDNDEIIALIKKNLDPHYSANLLLWKHCNNPFGQSISMVATENQRIIAVVFYMRYNFQNKFGKTIRTIRPLDVCTDKKYRGKGLFKILLKECLKRNTDYDMLFSTPNKKSYPEFIKLKWSPLLKNKFKIGLIFPFNFSKKISSKKFEIKETNKRNLISHRFFATATSLEFLSWRFPESEYFIEKVNHKDQLGYIIYRIGRIKGIKLLILCDYTGDENLLSSGLKKVSRKENVFLIYYLDNYLNRKIKFFATFPLKTATIVYKENNFALQDDFLISLADVEGKL